MEKLLCPKCGLKWQGEPNPGTEIFADLLVDEFKSTHKDQYIKNGNRIPANCHDCHESEDR